LEKWAHKQRYNEKNLYLIYGVIFMLISTLIYLVVTLEENNYILTIFSSVVASACTWMFGKFISPNKD